MWGQRWWRRRREEEIAEEIAVHLAMATRDRIARGMTADAARAAALAEFGNVPLIHQSTREVWSFTPLEQLLQDLRMGARILWHAPGLSLTAILLIALVIGGNTTIYSMVNGLLVSPAPGIAASRLVVVRHVESGVMLNDPFISFPNFEDYAARATTVTGLVGWSDERLTLATASGNYALNGSLVTPRYFDTLGVAIVRGRGLTPQDDAATEGLAAVISYRVWQERFHGVEDVAGQRAVIDGVPVSIVGVAGVGFSGALRTPEEDVWLPIRAYYRAIGSGAVLADRARPTVVVAGTLAARASLVSARAEFNALQAQLHASYPEAFTTYSAQGGVIPLKEPRVRVSWYSASALLPFADIAPRFLALFSIVTLITLLVVSANVANLMLGRAVQRQRDTAVRQSLGASRLRLLRLLIAEGMTLAVAAWGAACLFAWWMARALLRLIEPQPGFLDHARPDWTFLAYAIALAIVATLAFSVAPGIRVWRLQALPLLKAGEQSVVPGRSRLTSALVVLQLAFSVLLVTSAGLALRSMALFDSGHVGFDSEPLLLVTVRAAPARPHESAAPSPEQRATALARLERMRERLVATGNVESVTYLRRIPGAYYNAATPVRREDRDLGGTTYVRSVGPDYLRTLGIPVMAGRELTVADQSSAPRTAVVNEQLARELFPDGSPLGRVVRFGSRQEAVEIVGVAPNALFDGPVHDRRPRYLFIAEQQLPGLPTTDPTFLLRYRGSLDAVTPFVSRAIAEEDASLPIVRMTTMDERLAQVTVFEEALLQFLVYFALISLLIAALGQYAVAMFNARRRTRDFGVRIALGASAPQIQRAVMRETFHLTLSGVVIGFALSIVTAVIARDVLFGITPLDPVTYASVLALLAAVSAAASFIPAWRAGRVNVVDALRCE